MLKVLYSRRGTGKTKEMIKKANSDIGTVKGDVVFLDKDDHCKFDLHHDVRYIDTQQYRKLSLEYFMGFIGGVMASDYDIEKMYIDGVPGLLSEEDLRTAVKNIGELAKNNNVEVMMSISGKKEEMPDFIKEYIAE